jgi:cell division protein FtsW
MIKQCEFVAIALLGMYIFYKIPLAWFRSLAYLAFYGSLALLVVTYIFGKEINGAKRWLSIGPFDVQTTEIVKVTVVLFLAKTFEKNNFTKFRDFLIKAGIPVCAAVVLLAYGSVSCALFVMLISFIICFLAQVKWSYLFKLAGLGAGLLAILLVLNLSFGVFSRFDTAISRIEKFTSSEQIENKDLTTAEKQRIADRTLQADMARITISSVGLWGKGPGRSTQRYILPHPSSDFIFAIIVEEYGLLIAGIIIMLYVWFFNRCIVILQRCTTPFASLVSGGIGIMIVTQALLHILVNVGLLPVTGHTLPLISMGGSSLIIFSCAIGMVQSISRTIENVESIPAQVPSDSAENDNRTEKSPKNKDGKEGRYEIKDKNDEFK